MKTAYLRFALVSDYDAMRYLSVDRFPVLTPENFKIQKSIRDIPAMKIINAYRLPIGRDDESDLEDQVQFVVENVTEEILMLLMLAVGPDDFLEAW